MYKILFGLLAGIMLTITCTFVYRTYWLRDYATKPVFTRMVDTAKINYQQSIFQLNVVNANLDEKISSFNKRMDDFLVFGGIIITLLLAVTVSVYLKTETEVSKHFEERFGDYAKKVKEKHDEILTMVTRAQIEFENLQAFKKKLGTDNKNPE